jgi:hypothetical protein
MNLWQPNIRYGPVYSRNGIVRIAKGSSTPNTLLLKLNGRCSVSKAGCRQRRHTRPKNTRRPEPAEIHDSHVKRILTTTEYERELSAQNATFLTQMKPSIYGLERPRQNMKTHREL